MDEQEVRSAHDVLLRNRPAPIRSPDIKPSRAAHRASHSPNQFMDAMRLQDFMIITDVAFIVDLDQHVAVPAVKEPLSRIICCTNHGGLVCKPLVLAKIEIAKNHNH